jgi:hypothetical protein
LLYGTEKSDAARWLLSVYGEKLRKLAQRPGLGIHMPDDDPTGKIPAWIYPNPVIKEYREHLGVQRTKSQGLNEDPNAALFRDPVTGEDMRKDWVLTIQFKIQLGEMEPKPDEAKSNE